MVVSIPSMWLSTYDELFVSGSSVSSTEKKILMIFQRWCHDGWRKKNIRFPRRKNKDTFIAFHSIKILLGWMFISHFHQTKYQGSLCSLITFLVFRVITKSCYTSIVASKKLWSRISLVKYLLVILQSNLVLSAKGPSFSFNTGRN